MNLLSNHKGKKSLIALALATALTGCNDGENAKPAPAHNDHDHGHDPAPAVERHSRLVVSELSAEGNIVHVVDVNELNTIDTFTLDNALWRLKTSPEGRYVMALQRNESVIQTIDSGIAAEAHGDHYHLHADAPAFLDTKITHSRPTHFDVSGNEVAIFFDGDKAAGINASFHVYDEAAIATGQSLAHHGFDYAQHGTAQIHNQLAFTGIKTDLTIDSSRPDHVQVLERHHDHFHAKGEAQPCPLLHGSAQLDNYVAFGCADGIALSTVNGEEVTFEKVLNPETLTAGSSFTTVKAFSESKVFLVVTKGLEAYRLDPATKSLTAVNWKAPESDEKPLAYLATDKALVIVNNEGVLKIFEAAKNFQNPTITAPLWTTVPEKVQLVHDQRTGHFFAATSTEKRILEIDPAHADEVKSHELAYYPNQLAWAGTTQEEHHH